MSCCQGSLTDTTDLIGVINEDGYMGHLHLCRNEESRLYQKETYLFSKPGPGMVYIVQIS